MRHVVAVTSGKGGVGKSTVSLNVALALAERGRAVGLLDGDFYGPDIPLMVGITRTAPLARWDFWRAGANPVLEPVDRYGIRVMSVGFLLAERQAMTMPSVFIELVGRQLVHDVSWGELDLLVVDLPPGTADLQQQLVRLLAPAGALVVVGPQDVAHLDAKKVLDMLAGAGVRVLGGVENMSFLTCPNCGEQIEVFPSVASERSVWSLGVRRLGDVPLDPAIARAGDRGAPLLFSRPESPQADAFRRIADALAVALGLE